MKRILIFFVALLISATCYGLELDNNTNDAIDAELGGTNNPSWTAGEIPYVSVSTVALTPGTGAFDGMSGITTDSGNTMIHFADDKRVCFGNTTGSPDACMEWDTASNPDALYINNSLTLNGNLTTASSATPKMTFYDSDAVGTAKADEDCGSHYANFSDTTEDAEVSDHRISYFDAGTERTFLLWDASVWSLSLGVMLNDWTGGDVTGYESIKFDFDTGTDAEVEISSPSGATHIRVAQPIFFGANTNLVTKTAGATLTVAEMNGLVFMTAAGTLVLPEIVASSPTSSQVTPGASVCVAVRDDNEQVVIDPNNNDSITLSGTKDTAGDSIQNTVSESTGAGDFICLIAVEADNWFSTVSSGTWTAN